MNSNVLHTIEQHLLADKVGVVVGMGKSGLAAARLLVEMGARVRVVDGNADKTDDDLGELKGRVELQAGPHSPAQFADADIVVLSPGVARSKMAPYFEGLEPRRVVGELELAYWFTKAPIIAVTGSNGKTTTVKLIEAMLEKAGKNIFVGGNIGTPLSTYLLDHDQAEVIVLEVSSFQLQTIQRFQPRVGIFLNCTENHLDYHEDMEEYLQAKLNLFSQMTGEDTALLHESLRDTVTDLGFTNGHVQWFDAIDDFEAPHLLCRHNKSNIAAAWEACRRFGVTREQAAEAILEFTPPPHRIEPVGTVDGVLYVNDSKATSFDPVIKAVGCFDRPVRLLMGGVYKGGDVDALADTVRDKVVAVGLFGDSRDIFEPGLARRFPVTWDDTLEEAVRRQAAAAAPGDVVLLSPGTSSFDRYNNMGERGDDFKRVVREMGGSHGD